MILAREPSTSDMDSSDDVWIDGGCVYRAPPKPYASKRFCRKLEKELRRKAMLSDYITFFRDHSLECSVYTDSIVDSHGRAYRVSQPRTVSPYHRSFHLFNFLFDYSVPSVVESRPFEVEPTAFSCQSGFEDMKKKISSVCSASSGVFMLKTSSGVDEFEYPSDYIIDFAIGQLFSYAITPFIAGSFTVVTFPILNRIFPTIAPRFRFFGNLRHRVPFVMRLINASQTVTECFPCFWLKRQSNKVLRRSLFSSTRNLNELYGVCTFSYLSLKNLFNRRLRGSQEELLSCQSGFEDSSRLEHTIAVKSAVSNLLREFSTHEFACSLYLRTNCIDRSNPLHGDSLPYVVALNDFRILSSYPNNVYHLDDFEFGPLLRQADYTNPDEDIFLIQQQMYDSFSLPLEAQFGIESGSLYGGLSQHPHTSPIFTPLVVDKCMEYHKQLAKLKREINALQKKVQMYNQRKSRLFTQLAALTLDPDFKDFCSQRKLQGKYPYHCHPSQCRLRPQSGFEGSELPEPEQESQISTTIGGNAPTTVLSVSTDSILGSKPCAVQHIDNTELIASLNQSLAFKPVANASRSKPPRPPASVRAPSTHPQHDMYTNMTMEQRYQATQAAVWRNWQK